MKRKFGLVFGILVLVSAGIAQQRTRTPEEPSWAPKYPPGKYVAPHKPHTKLADIKATAQSAQCLERARCR